MEQQHKPTALRLDDARAFVQAAEWTWASTYAHFAPHEYTTRWSCRARGIESEFEAFVRTIEAAGYWRPWGSHRWHSLNLDDRFYWLHWNIATVAERTVINRWWLDAASAESTQLALQVDR